MNMDISREPLVGPLVADVREELRSLLLAARNADGGWSYAALKRSRIEPTAWALLALDHADDEVRHSEVLTVWRRQGGWLVDVAGVPANHAFNALAALTMLRHPEGLPLAWSIAEKLIAAKGLRGEQTELVRQDNSLQAWSWVEGTASWVEPTAWCLLLLKKLPVASTSADAQERIAVGERMLLDRMCRGGGWNYGNPVVHGKDLWPYAPTTALALLAMQDRRDHPMIQRSLSQLHRDVSTERSVVSLALYVICLRVYGLAFDAAARQLEELCAVEFSASRWDGDLLGLAMALYALSAPDVPPAAFTV